MARIITIASGRRAKWWIFGVWLLIFFGVNGAGLPKKFTDGQKNDAASFLPTSVESTKALNVTKRLQGSELAPMVAIFRRAGGLTQADLQNIRGRVAAFNSARAQRAGAGEDPFKRTTPMVKTAQTRDAVLFVSQIQADTGKPETITHPVDQARKNMSNPGGGLDGKITGGAGLSADAIKVFKSINGTLLIAAVALVFFLLALIYRSPTFLWIPLLSVVFAEIASEGLGYALEKVGVTVNGQSSSILSVLVLGAGTDYALLLVSRYREELHRHEDKHEALALALRAAGPAIVASACTVTIALLCLSVAKVNGTAGLGPIGAMGIVVALITQLTLLPAALVIFGRRAFWPLIPYGPAGGPPLKHRGPLRRINAWGRAWEQRHRADETHGIWRRVGDWVARSPRKTGALFAGGLLLCVLGILNFNTGLTQSDGYRNSPESVEGQTLLAQSFPAGASAPADIIVPDRSKAPAVIAAVSKVPGVAFARPNPNVKPGTREALLAVTLKQDPYSNASLDLVPDLRRAAKSAGGPDVLVGGPSAIQKDLNDASARDTRIIVPMVLVVVFVILALLLRALLAPLLLTLTVILSYLASLGVGAIVFDVVFGFPGSDVSLPLFAFVFLVALGIDYNIFLMARVREETLKHGTHDGMLRGLAVTGGVITSAGIVLAGTFSVLAVLPLVFLTEIGFLIAFGVLLDTFIVRSILVPALVLDLGKRIWLPSRLARAES